MLAMRLGLKNVSVLAPQDASEIHGEHQESGLGRIGDLTEATDLDSFCRKLKKDMDLESVRMVGNPRQMVNRVAVCSGSGSSLLDRFFSSDADVFITGDIRYHEAREAEDRMAALIDIGHFGSEHIMIAQLATRLKKMLEQLNPNVEVITCEAEKDPFIVI
jgi:putative NIF3 family GTP cyclohydrolase 1 type 2